MKYLVKGENGNKYDPLLYGCQECCMACKKPKKEQKKCKYQMARQRAVNRMLYKAKKATT